ncbi:hypothetical protein KBX08_32480 [Micromonospora sp. H61]|uniref:hypothetical protein n=1 Tax=Micromonospora sp. H61 TaxID=2824888 RepID=UPI001B37F135|nr:hypothetical protein [Micromonospora sp. H61]MBQ0994778.1 hypothetical protein [Micromonospora sp. H61]
MLQEDQPVGQVPHPDRQEAVDHLRAQLAQHGEDRLRISKGEFLNEVAPVVISAAEQAWPVTTDDP